MAKQTVTELKAKIARLERANENLNETIEQGLELISLIDIHSLTPSNIERLIDMTNDVLSERSR